MSGAHSLVTFFLLIVGAVLIRLFIGWLNHNRIRTYIAERGGTVLGITWKPFGRGWFGEKDSVIYEVRYKDAKGNVILSDCKTGLFSGVYFTHERTIRSAPRDSASQPPPPLSRVATVETNTGDEGLLREVERLRQENRKLREELEELRRRVF